MYYLSPQFEKCSVEFDSSMKHTSMVFTTQLVLSGITGYYAKVQIYIIVDAVPYVCGCPDDQGSVESTFKSATFIPIIHDTLYPDEI
jgi:hypothetical protein